MLRQYNAVKEWSNGLVDLSVLSFERVLNNNPTTWYFTELLSTVLQFKFYSRKKKKGIMKH